MSVSLDMVMAPRFDRGITVVRIFNGQQGARTPIISMHTYNVHILCLEQLLLSTLYLYCRTWRHHGLSIVNATSTLFLTLTNGLTNIAVYRGRLRTA